MKSSTTSLVAKVFLVLTVLFGAVRVAHGQGLFERNLRLGDQGEDVRQLQIFLNTHGAPVAETGVGSFGQETNVFGQKTQQAVAAFQELHRTKILAPSRLSRGTGNFYKATREFVNALDKKVSTKTQSVATAATSSVQASVVPDQPRQAAYVVGGMVTGLTGPVVVREASGETLHLKPGDSANFVFSRTFSPGDRYDVTAISAAPGPQQCYVSSNGSGAVADGSIQNIHVQCTSDGMGNPFRSFAGHGTQSYALGGTISGLSGTVVLQTAEGDGLTLTGNGSFTFGSRILNGRAYSVTVRTNPSVPDQTCTVTNGSGLIANNHVTNVLVTCVTNVTTLSASVSDLALSIAGLVGAPASGSPRVIIVTNTGATAARGLEIASPTWPTGTVSNTTCSGTLAAGASCMITVTPGGTPTSDGGSPCSDGVAPVPGIVQVTADNANTVSTNVVVLSYGCIYQEGFVFSIDDTTPSTQSIGGTVAALENQSNGMVWGSNGVDASTVSYDVIPGIGDTSTSLSTAPTFSEVSTYFGSTYSGILGLSSGSFSSCNGNTDGQCNTSNIVAFYNHYQTNYGIGGSPYTPVVAPTAKSYYAAGVCDDYDSGDHQDWYLPAICEITFDYPLIRPQIADCGVEETPLLQTMMKNLFFNGIGGFTAGQGLWSSSLYMYNNPETYAWSALVWPTAFPGGGDKSDLSQVRCVRSLTF